MQQRPLRAVRRAMLGLGLVALTFPAAAAKPVHAGAVERIRRAGVLRVGVFAQLPWAMADRSGAWSGFDIDVGRQLAQDLGVRVEFVRVSWIGAADDAAAGRVDVVAGLWPGPRRALVVDFSAPYASAQVELVVNREKAAGLRALSDFDRATVRIGVREGGLSQATARAVFPKATLLAFDSDAGELDALLSGRLHAVVGRTPAPALLVHAAPDKLAMPLPQVLASRSESFAVARGDADWLAYLNAWIRFSEENGWLGQRRAYWFEGIDWHASP
jgi:polar amino acid transport system substrate-binding protein